MPVSPDTDAVTPSIAAFAAGDRAAATEADSRCAPGP